MNRFSEVISSIKEKGRRIIKLTQLGKSDTRKVYEGLPFGFDSQPPKDMRAVVAETPEKGKLVVLGYVNTNQKAGDGELRLYSTNPKGDTEKAYMYLVGDGTMELNGNADHLVRFSELKAAFDELKDDYNTHKHTYQDDNGSSTTAKTTSSPNSSSSADVDPSKVDSVKTP